MSEHRRTKGDRRATAEICRERDWGVGTCLEGDEGYGPTVIRITAVGEKSILARKVAQDGIVWNGASEAQWGLSFRDWRQVADPVVDRPSDASEAPSFAPEVHP